jgi:hypothetical protein
MVFKDKKTDIYREILLYSPNNTGYHGDASLLKCCLSIFLFIPTLFIRLFRSRERHGGSVHHCKRQIVLTL